ncbi:uncharacterized protein MICPUCDRAFT_51241 [Micromonas pusilla CCMP1545]|uniref:Predicted protein n=1 Tax=Micromonas pusilla (strain CCMP1545) TaxID=564608 RepID=C1N130_MICPC|nr:uncharacterized protein MICPUCDRAFT_51241 [Micromonas pusilla CCMP1545]EEH54129.1 predicted protein [Micromonas pusilla CCMP1545]|eukprot:XP_003061499.1 predicted protein [Micromonas pusilla CCMP1545]
MATTEPVPADAAPATAEETVTAADSALAPAARDVDATSTATATSIGGVDDRRSVPAPSSPSYDDGRGVAFFDLDHTLIDTNSSWLWMKHELNNGKVGAGMLATSVYWFARYAMGFGSGAERAGAEAAELYAGTPEEKLRREVDAFFEKELAHRARPGGKPIMEKHIRAGERCVVCTSSWQHPAASAARLFNCESAVDDVISSVMEVDEAGNLTGKIAKVCYGDGKSVVTEAWCARRGIDLAKCYFYTDSMSDVSLLEKVGHPVAVNPDRRLRAHAKKRGWAVMDWGVAKPKDPMKKPRYSYGCLAFHGAKSGPG